MLVPVAFAHEEELTLREKVLGYMQGSSSYLALGVGVAILTAGLLLLGWYRKAFWLRLAAIVVSIALMGVIILIIEQKPSQGVLGEVHRHADFKVFIDGVPLNFSSEKYMGRSNFVHMHDLDSEVVHQHIRGVTFGDFFESLDMTFNSTCLVLDNASSYCNTDGKKVQFYVNGKQNKEFEHYEFEDLDRMLITYGVEDNDAIKKQYALVTDRACIQSGTCPERGIPADESSCLSTSGCSVEGSYGE